MATLLTVTIDPALRRNAREELRTRVEGAVSLLDNPVVIADNTSSLEVQLPDALPAEELKAIVRAVANLVGRPGSGLLGPVALSPDAMNGLQRVYSV